MLRDTIDELDGLVTELTELGQRLRHADATGAPDDALWDVHTRLAEVSRRSGTHATTVRRLIELRRTATESSDRGEGDGRDRTAGARRPSSPSEHGSDDPAQGHSRSQDRHPAGSALP